MMTFRCRLLLTASIVAHKCERDPTSNGGVTPELVADRYGEHPQTVKKCWSIVVVLRSFCQQQPSKYSQLIPRGKWRSC